MRKINMVSFAALALAASFAFGISAEVKKRSSEIPARREFPVSKTANPCVDFYQYACSEVIDSFQLREDRSGHTFSFSDARERLLDYKKNYFKNLSSQKAENVREQDLKNYYMSCMDTEKRAVAERHFVEKSRKELTALTTRDELVHFFQNRLLGEKTAFLSYDVGANNDKPDYYDLYFDTLFMNLPEQSYYTKPDVMADLRRNVADFFKAIGESQPDVKAGYVIRFESALAKVYPTPEKYRELFSMQTGVTKAELKKKYPALISDDFLAKIPDRAHIRHVIPEAMAFLNTQMELLPLEELKAIYLYFSVSGNLDQAYPDYFNKRFAFNHKHLGGPARRPEQSEMCTQRIIENFDRELDSILWKRVFPNFPKEKIVKIGEKIRQAILATLSENTWLSAEAKKEAMNKIRTAQLQLVAPKNATEWHLLPIANFSADDEIENQEKYVRLVRQKALGDLKGKVSRNRWWMGPLTINAYYDSSYNKFVLPVGILQHPFFDPNFSDEENLAAIGTVIGHELGHGIDDQGSKYDAKGILRSWMTKKDLDTFAKRGEKLVTQFNRIGHNGQLTLGENIGDLVGLTNSYRAAFGDVIKTDDPAVKEKQKKFFEQYAHLWCQIMRPAFAKMRLKTDPHSLGTARVNEQIKQQPAFREVYDCKPSDPMVLPDQDMVTIW